MAGYIIHNLALRVQELRHAECQALRIFAQISSRYCFHYRARSANSFVRSRDPRSPEERYELSITVTRDHCERKVQVAPRATYVSTREKSREIARKCCSIIREHTITINNELMCYRLNEKRNIQAPPNLSLFLLSIPLPCPIVTFCLPYLSSVRLSRRHVVINGRVINASVTVTSHG